MRIDDLMTDDHLKENSANDFGLKHFAESG
jgi:hypothetical protein